VTGVDIAADLGYLNFGRALRLSADKFRNDPCLSYGDSLYTFVELNRQVNCTAHALRAQGVQAGDVVVIVSANSPDYVRLLFALAKLGATSVPINISLTTSDLAQVIAASRPVAVAASGGHFDRVQGALHRLDAAALPALLPLPEDRFAAHTPVAPPEWLAGPADPSEPPESGARDSDPAVLLFTSGSMGTPKAVVKSYANIVWHSLNRQLSEPRQHGDRELFVLPLSGVGLGNFLITDVLVGATCVLEPAFDPNVTADRLADAAISHVFLAPTMMMAISAARPSSRFPGVEVVETAYEVTLQQRQRIAEMFPSARIIYSYGCTEGSMATAPQDAFLGDPTCVGFASGLDEYRVVKDGGLQAPGAIEVSGPTVMRGYLTDDGKGVSDDVVEGWFDTGDLGWLDERRRLHFTGRAKDMIKSGGMNVFARDVELVLMNHPSLAQVAVIGVPDDYWGEAVVAVVEPRVGAAVTADDLAEYARANLAGYRRPKRYYVTDRMPLNSTGKLAKGIVRADVLAERLTELTSSAPSTCP
jgi:fatty-acyl-CoA synthase